MKQAVSLIVFMVVCSLAFFSLKNVSASAAFRKGSALENSMAPDFTLETLKGKTVALKDFKGKGVIIFFFTTWCPYCRERLPDLARDYESYRKQGIELLVIDAGETKNKVNSFAANRNFPFDILLDVKTDVAGAYGIIGIPTFALISKEGKVVYFGNDLPSHYASLVQK